jgi:hypothetical protein
VTRWLLLLALALAIGPAAAQVADPSSPSVTVTMLQYRGDRPHDEPWIMIATDGTGNARDAFAAGHGGMGFMTRDGVGYVLVERGDSQSLGRQEDMLSMFAVGGSGRANRALIERLVHQQIAIEPGGTEQVAGVEGRIYRLTLTGGGEAPHSFELVISTDPRLAPAGREILRFYDQLRAPIVAVTGTEPQPYAAVRSLLARGTPLRVGPHYRLREMETRQAPAGIFALPGPVLTREAFLAYLDSTGMFADPDLQQSSGGDFNDAMMAAEAAMNEATAAEKMDADAAANVAAAVAEAASAAANAAIGAPPENDVRAGNAANPH